MKFMVKSVASVEGSVGFRLIGCLEAETEKEKTETLPMLVDNMKSVLSAYARDVQADVKDDTIYYRAISLSELSFVLGLFNKNLRIPTTAHLAEDVAMYPEEIRSLFKFQFDCFKLQNNL